jgi:carboxylesterase
VSEAPAVEVVVDAFDLPAAAGPEVAGDGRAAALCLHGLTGTPYEMRAVAEVLAARGIRARGPALPGHNSQPEMLARCSHGEWVEAAQREVEELRAHHERVFAVGLSMGGLVSLALAEAGAVDALAVVGTPLRLRPALLRWLIPVLKHLKPFAPKRQGSDICDPEARARHPGYPVMPLHSVHELMRLQSRVVAELSHIEVPILIAHGALDGTAHPSDADWIAAEVRSSRCERLVLERSAHVVPVDYDGARLAEAVAEFLLGLG